MGNKEITHTHNGLFIMKYFQFLAFSEEIIFLLHKSKKPWMLELHDNNNDDCNYCV
jgi:hypothetical protein